MHVGIFDQNLGYILSKQCKVKDIQIHLNVENNILEMILLRLLFQLSSF